LAVNNGGYGFQTSLSEVGVLVNCAGFNNTSGNVYGAPILNEGFLDLSADPFMDAAGHDYRPNNIAGGGAALRAAGVGVASQTNNEDIGAVQHTDPAGGGGLLIHPGMDGGMRG